MKRKRNSRRNLHCKAVTGEVHRKDLFYAFADLEKAFDRVPKDVVRWALRQLGVEE